MFGEKHIKLVEYQQQLASTLVKIEKPRRRSFPTESSPTESPSSLNHVVVSPTEEKVFEPKRALPCNDPPTDVRLDRYGHFPIYIETRKACKLPSCNKRSYIACSKCQVHLCLSKERNCYKVYHTQGST